VVGGCDLTLRGKQNAAAIVERTMSRVLKNMEVPPAVTMLKANKRG
jgi:hypothetical protein